MEALQGTARKLWDFAKAHGLRDDWHEPDEQGIEIIVYGDIFDNARGDLDHVGDDSDEIGINLYKSGGSNYPNYQVYINLATLCALATIGAGVVLCETKQPTAPKPDDLRWHMPVMQAVSPADVPRFSRNDLTAILSTVLKSIGES